MPGDRNHHLIPKMHRLLSFCFHFRFFTYKPFAIQETTSVKAGKFPANICTKTHIKPGNRSLYAGQTVTFRRTKPSLPPGKAFTSSGQSLHISRSDDWQPVNKGSFPFLRLYLLSPEQTFRTDKRNPFSNKYRQKLPKTKNNIYICKQTLK